MSNAYNQEESHIRKRFEIVDGLSPKSVVTNGFGIFSAQNMMYRHSIMLFNQQGERLAQINDEVNLNDFGFTEYSNQLYHGSPVEAVFTSDSNYLWVSNYQMFGAEFNKPGCDHCVGAEYDPSFLYKINIRTFKIENIIKVGSVPKFLAISEDNKLLIASNWVSSDISIIDIEKEKEIKRVKLGPHPRGITITKDGKTAFVTIMGSNKIAEVNLFDYNISYHKNIGKAPRSILLADHDSTLYISVNSSNNLIKLNRYTNERIICNTQSGPRSITLSPNEKWLYVVNYFDDSFSKINTSSMQIEATIPTGNKPIGICGDWENGELWIACYSGKIEIFRDFKLQAKVDSYFGFSLASFLTLSTDKPNDKKEINKEGEYKSTIIPKTKDSELEKNSKTSSNKTDSENECNYHIIIDAFSVFENAVKRKEEMIELNYPSKIIQGKLNYVSIGCYENRSEAEKQQQIIRTSLEGCESAWILKK